MLKIKLSPRGKKHQRTFRIVVAERRSKNKGQNIDEIGFFTPQTKTINLDKAKMDQWLKHGAKITTGVDKLLNPAKYPHKKKVKQAKSLPKTNEPTPTNA
ncbi:MAG TPA: 30S ribosomal protein S16 [Candidatus Woesebacteria bacterium]|mgnify:CR=1 FL=1|nr:30S ribosomal protein S16 [Candidatus Woesebacteria bacterium]HRS23111.1 30S ribosomal protein S16 [Candidatus Woesebacteria bacterium]HRT40220.1 30S ribosomal protein S16 [Candidatus Woesebacteria bacterium]